MLHVGLTVSCFFFLTPPAAYVHLGSWTVHRMGLVQDEDGGLSLTSVDKHPSVVDWPLRGLWLCSGDAAWRYVGDCALLAVSTCMLPKDELNYYFNTWTDDVNESSEREEGFLSRGHCVPCVTALTCESGGYGRAATDHVLRVPVNWTAVTLRLQLLMQLSFPGVDRLTSASACGLVLAVRSLARVAFHGSWHQLFTGVALSATPIEADQVCGETLALLHRCLQRQGSGCSAVWMMNKILPALITVMRKHFLHLSTDRTGVPVPARDLHAPTTYRPYRRSDTDPDETRPGFFVLFPVRSVMVSMYGGAVPLSQLVACLAVNIGHLPSCGRHRAGSYTSGRAACVFAAGAGCESATWNPGNCPCCCPLSY